MSRTEREGLHDLSFHGLDEGHGVGHDIVPLRVHPGRLTTLLPVCKALVTPRTGINTLRETERPKKGGNKDRERKRFIVCRAGKTTGKSKTDRTTKKLKDTREKDKEGQKKIRYRQKH